MNHDNFQAERLYHNPGYKRESNRKMTLILDVKDSSDATQLGSGTEFKIDLFEPCRVPWKGEMYLDNFVTHNSMLADKEARTSMCLKINEFNMNTNCASNNSEKNLYNSIVIPNENRNVDNFFTSVSHKAKKYNYLCDVNPMTITSISGKITDLDGNPIFHGDSTTSNYYTYALLNITSPWEDTDGVELAETVKTHIPTGTEFTLANDGGANHNCRTVATFSKDSSALYFATNEASEITISDYNNKNHTTVTITHAQLTASHIDNSAIFTGGNFVLRTDYPTLIRGSGRMVAELSIVSRE